MESTVRQILQNKGEVVWSVSPDATVLEALELMAEKDIGAVPVVKDGKLVGIFSERDYARQAVRQRETLNLLPVSTFMTTDVITVSPTQTVKDCMILMTARRIRHLPVIENDSLVGIITIGDVVKTIISDQALLLEEMEKYISGRYIR
ncbi:MAG: CBS domain-containing protein [Chloroflexota bacterium]|nr:MAG: inosine-5-monophosphate dehydrogenase [Bellilinea sp.]